MFTRALIAALQTLSAATKDEPLPAADVRQIVAVELTRLGDVITAVGTLRVLREHFPFARIVLFVQERYAPLVNALDLKVEAVGVASTETFAGFLMGVRAVRNCAPDLCLSLSPAKRNSLCALSSGAEFIAGYLRPVDKPIQYLQTAPVEAIGFRAVSVEPYTASHLAERSERVLDALGLPRPATPVLSTLKQPQQHDASTSLPAELMDNGRSSIVIHPFATWGFKCWPMNSFVDVAAGLLPAFPGSVIFLCEKGEEGRWAEARSRFPGHPRVAFIASDDLVRTAAIVQRASLVIGNDSGPLHLAALLGTPVLGIYGPSTPSLTAPRGAGGIFLYHPVPCSPCPQDVCVRPADHCMRLVTPAEVLDAAATLLRGRSTNVTAAYA